MRVRATAMGTRFALFRDFINSIDKTDDLSQYDHLVHPYLM